mgnify:FL=1
MITKEQAVRAHEFHYTGKQACHMSIGPRGGISAHKTVCRRNGQTRTWKRDVARFEVPIKYGLYEYSTINQNNAANWHVAEDCPCNQRKESK